MTLDTNLTHAVPVTFGNKVVRGIPQEDGTYLQIGNTNGNPVSPTLWLYYAIVSGKGKASPAWGASAQLHGWYSNQHYGASFVNHWLPIAITATTELAVAYGFAEAGAADAAGNAGADASTISENAAPQVSFTGEIAQPVEAIDTGITTQTIGELSTTGLTVADGATAASVGSEIATAAAGTAIKAVAAVGAAKIIGDAKSAADIAGSSVPPAPAVPAAGSTDWKKLLTYGVFGAAALLLT